MTIEELRAACEMADLLVMKCVNGPYILWPIPCSQGEHEMTPLDNEWWRPIITAYVAQLLLEKVQAASKGWAIETGIENRYGATCWTCTITNAQILTRIISCECLFIVTDTCGIGRGPGRHEQHLDYDNGGTWHEIILWARGEDDDDSFCGRAEVEIRAAMEALKQRTEITRK